MRKVVRSLALASEGSLVLAATALADPSSPNSPVTKSLPGLPCSVTATFRLSAGARTMAFGGGVSCTGGVGAKTVDVVPQVYTSSTANRCGSTLAWSACTRARRRSARCG